jgi:hypothetical protein
MKENMCNACALARVISIAGDRVLYRELFMVDPRQHGIDNKKIRNF